MIKFRNSVHRLIQVSFALIVCIGTASHPSLAEEQIEALRAPFHVGESVLACGKVAQVTSLPKITHINLDQPYPKSTLDLVIWSKDLRNYESRFGLLSGLEGKRVCALGMIEDYHNHLQIIMRNPQFLRLMK